MIFCYFNFIFVIMASSSSVTDPVIRACRSCLATNMNFQNLCGSLLKTFEFCVNLSIKSNEGHQVICDDCAENLNKFSEFKKQCQKHDSFWKSLEFRKKYLPDESEIKTEVFDVINITKYDEDDRTRNFDTDYMEQNETSVKEENDDHKQDGKYTVPATDRKQYECQKCKKTLRNKSRFNKHVNYCKKVRKLPKVTKIVKPKSEKPLKEIEQKLLKDEEHLVGGCGLCEYSSDSNDYREHLEGHRLDNTLACKLCDFTGSDFADMIAHRSSHIHRKYWRKCHLCSRVFHIPRRLEFHFRRVHLNKQAGGCRLCGKKFNSYKACVGHERLHEIQGYVCDHCGKKFLYKFMLIDHLEKISNIRKFICPTCGKQFTRNAYMNLHLRTVHVNDPVKCNHCNKTFKNKESHKEHIKSVNMNKPFLCDVCSKAFRSENTLEKHRFWHTGEKPFACHICESKYKAKSQLKIHMRTHTGDFPYKCELCPKSFSSSNPLKRHQSVHTGVRPVPCIYCERTFYGKKLMLIHCASRHKYLKEPL